MLCDNRAVASDRARALRERGGLASRTHTRAHTRTKNQGLRLHDNPALLEACRDAQHVYPIFVIDPHFIKSGQYR